MTKVTGMHWGFFTQLKPVRNSFKYFVLNGRILEGACPIGEWKVRCNNGTALFTAV